MSILVSFRLFEPPHIHLKLILVSARLRFVYLVTTTVIRFRTSYIIRVKNRSPVYGDKPLKLQVICSQIAPKTRLQS